MTAVVKVTDSMGDHWVYDGISVYPHKAGDGFYVPAFRPCLSKQWHFPTLDAAVDAIRTHLKEGG